MLGRVYRQLIVAGHRCACFDTSSILLFPLRRILLWRQWSALTRYERVTLFTRPRRLMVDSIWRKTQQANRFVYSSLAFEARLGLIPCMLTMMLWTCNSLWFGDSSKVKKNVRLFRVWLTYNDRPGDDVTLRQSIVSMQFRTVHTQQLKYTDTKWWQLSIFVILFLREKVMYIEGSIEWKKSP